MTFIIPVAEDQIRTLKDPNNSKIRVVHAFVRVTDLPSDIPLDPDPRVPKISGAVPQRILTSLRLGDGKFHLKNRGITISAKRCEYDNKAKVLRLTIPNDDQFGILDGAHTYFCVNEAVRLEQQESERIGKTGDRLANQYVHLEILERVEPDLADIAEARNFSVALKAWTLANYRDKFDWLLDAVGGDFKKHIRVSENNPEPVGILDVIQVLSAINPVLFPEEKPAVDAYKNVGKMFNAFIDQGDKFQFKKFSPIASEALRLFDYIRYNFKEKYNAPDEFGRRGRFGKTKEGQDAQEARRTRSRANYYFLKAVGGPVSGEAVIDKGFSIPLLSGFRALIESNDHGFAWITDPFEFFDRYGTKLVRTVMIASDANGGDPHDVCRDPQIYQQLTSEVRRWYLESQFENRKR